MATSRDLQRISEELAQRAAKAKQRLDNIRAAAKTSNPPPAGFEFQASRELEALKDAAVKAQQARNALACIGM